MNGVLVIDKPSGPSSHDVVARIRRRLEISKAGHTGTLDPLATGVLPLVLGRATRLARFFAASDKAYDAAIKLGVSTDSYDMTGALETFGQTLAHPAPDRATVEAILEEFRGEQWQEPPPFSAKKIDGVRAYKLARQRQPVQPSPVAVTVHELELVSLEKEDLRLRIVCSAGFYVRTLAHSLGRRLGTGACLQALRRTRSGQFTLAQSLSFEKAERSPDAALGHIVPMEHLLTALQGVTLTEAGVRRARHGNELRPQDLVAPLASIDAERRVRLLDPRGLLVAIGEAGTEPGTLHPAVVLM